MLLYNLSLPAAKIIFYSGQVCLNWHVLIWKYSLNMCCQCFHQYAKDIGFIKLD
ncbi:40S ribosomal protein S29-like [Ochotona curzoniae]|uniref:40S ribosomal protein S29-like n=1 Tax=Ochotona curzoniae TaxID=130825 RepID=UPI001B349A5E|nr:40S ribosomal protein S29-like [Ochotona curzoniae]